MKKLFLFACFLIPFENFFFAPSAGWAAIAPIVFFLYAMINFKETLRILGRNYKLLLILIWGIIVTLINSFICDIDVGNLIGTGISMLLGVFFYISLEIYFGFGGNGKKVGNVLSIAYCLSLCVGLVQYITIQTGNSVLMRIILAIEKRSYIGYGRVQYTFTEPSFIGMHIFGVLLPVYILTKQKKIRYIMVSYVLLSIFMGCGVRIIMDTAFFLLVLLFYRIDLKKTRNLITLMGILIIGVAGVLYVYNTNYRVRSIMQQGIYADGSLATRWFRINASLKGYGEEDGHVLLGYGYGNAITPLRKGYAKARAEYKHWNTSEINQLIDKNFTSDSVAYCLYIRIISEFGILVFAYLLISFYKRWKNITNKEIKICLVMIIYLYIQFDSYAFYSLWIMLYILKHFGNKRENDRVIKCEMKR